jgi:methionyl-tRNA formyltransferase
MRIVFMGTAELACPCLEALARLPSHEVVAVVTRLDKPKGRDLKLSPPPVKVTAVKLGLPVLQPVKVRESVEEIRALQPDLIVVVAYGQILPRAVLDLPPRGCINVHASLLPRWRGAAPIQHAILAGDAETGVTTMFLNEKMDEGDIILQRAEPIRADDTSGVLHDRLAKIGAELLVETVMLETPPHRSQDHSQATYARKLAKEDGRVDWTKPAVEIERMVRAFNPWPGAHTFAGDLLLKVLCSGFVPDVQAPPGTVLPGFVVATGEGGLRILELQPSGKRRMSAAEFLRGRNLEAGAVLY